MITNKRQEEILTILREKKHVPLNYLAQKIYVSLVTLRRDLRQLEEGGLVKRCYGWVSILETENKIAPIFIREEERRIEKTIIAKKAAQMIQIGDTILLDSSSTALRIIDFLPVEMNITVITNSIQAVIALNEKKITAYCTGGMLFGKSMAFVGTFAERAIESIHADKFFFSSLGLSTNGDITGVSESETHLRQMMLKRAKYKVFLCDSSKVGKTFLFTVCHVSEVDRVICDKPIDDMIDEQKS